VRKSAPARELGYELEHAAGSLATGHTDHRHRAEKPSRRHADAHDTKRRHADRDAAAGQLAYRDDAERALADGNEPGRELPDRDEPVGMLSGIEESSHALTLPDVSRWPME
jgi:hypothetical protein